MPGLGKKKAKGRSSYEMQKEHLKFDDSVEREKALPAWESVAGSVKPRHSEVPALDFREDKHGQLDALVEEDTKNQGEQEVGAPDIVEESEKKQSEFLKVDETSEKGKNKAEKGLLGADPAGDEGASNTPTPIPESVRDSPKLDENDDNKGQLNVEKSDNQKSNENNGGTKKSTNNQELTAGSKSPAASGQGANKSNPNATKSKKSKKPSKLSDTATEDIRLRMLPTKPSDKFSKSKLDSDEAYGNRNGNSRRTLGSRSPLSSMADGVIDWKLSENRSKHFTSFFDDALLIVRRGFPLEFRVTGKLQRVKLYNIPSKYSTQCSTEPPRYMIEVTLTLDSPECSNWKLEKVDKDCTLHLPATCIVGLWLIKLRVNGEDYREDLRILFNPWCPEDEVFMEEANDRQEYILNESGRLYTFGYLFYPWFFGQFEHRIIDIVLYLLDKSNLSTAAKCSAVFVARSLSALINQERDGVITARWQEPYTGGYDPKHWHSSVDILNRFYRTRKQVSYGQCWVFSGLFVTIMRALGIPCRTVTNNWSFHDSNRNNVCEWDIMHDGSVKKLEYVWNFHVWTEVWMRRNDLPQGYDGWQVIDSTPQEMIEGTSIAGPAPVKAIKEAALHLPYDTEFIFSEVNSDIAYWRRDRDGQMGKLIKLDQEKIGNLILTKNIGDSKANNLLLAYRMKSGKENSSLSLEEKSKVLRVFNPGVNLSLYESLFSKKSGVEIKLHVPDYIAIGNDFQFSAEIYPTAKGAIAEAKVTICVFVSTNTGKFIGQVAKYDHNKIKISKDTPLRGRIEYGKYRRFAGASYTIKLLAVCQLAGSEADINCDFAAIPFHCRPPEIKILSTEPFVQGEPVDIKLSFVNEFKFGLSGCYFELSAPRMKPKAFGIKKGLGSGESCYIHLQYKPKRAGDIMLIAKFGCREISITCGSVELYVVKKVE